MPDVREIFESFDLLPAHTTPLHRPAGAWNHVHGPTTKTQTTGVLMDTDGDKVAALNRRWKTASEC